MSGKRDYETLSNAELERLLHERIPRLTVLSITDETRNTAIAILKITEDKEE